MLHEARLVPLVGKLDRELPPNLLIEAVREQVHIVISTAQAIKQAVAVDAAATVQASMFRHLARHLPAARGGVIHLGCAEMVVKGAVRNDSGPGNYYLVRVRLVVENHSDHRIAGGFIRHLRQLLGLLGQGVEHKQAL